MTVGNPTPEVDWRLVVRTIKESGTADGRVRVKKMILDAAGVPLRLREARGRLFILTKSASEGRPALIETEGGLVCVIALNDLVDIVMERGAGVGGADVCSQPVIFVEEFRDAHARRSHFKHGVDIGELHQAAT